MPVPEPTLIEYRLTQVERAMDKVSEAIQDFRVDLATKAEVQALEDRIRKLEEERTANRPWVAPTALLSAVAAVLGGAWSVTHGG